MSLFLEGIIAGVFIGLFLGVFVLALMQAAKANSDNENIVLRQKGFKNSLIA